MADHYIVRLKCGNLVELKVDGVSNPQEAIQAALAELDSIPIGHAATREVTVTPFTDGEPGSTQHWAAKGKRSPASVN